MPQWKVEEIQDAFLRAQVAHASMGGVELHLAYLTILSLLVGHYEHVREVMGINISITNYSKELMNDLCEMVNVHEPSRKARFDKIKQKQAEAVMAQYPTPTGKPN